MQALHTVHKAGWTPAYDWWAEHQMDHTSRFAACALWMETVPVMPATVLGLELLSQDHSLDLQMASDLILKDVGATLKIMCLIAREFPTVEERPSRMADCLAVLGTATWFRTISSNDMRSRKTPTDLPALWKHCRCVAQYSKLIAESLGEVSGEEAYLAGLLHEVENLAFLFGKGEATPLRDGLKLNQVLSPSLLAALQSAQARGSGSIWRYVLASAHALATAGPSPELPKFHSSKPFVV